jgi:hypothetical protein
VATYEFHPPVIIMLARVLHELSMPALAKAVVLTGLSGGASFVLSETVFRRVPLLRQIL